MQPAQLGILAPLPPAARFLTFDLRNPAAARVALQALRQRADGTGVVVGLGAGLVSLLEGEVPGMMVFPALAYAGVKVPSTPGDLLLWLRGAAPGELLNLTHELEALLAPAFTLASAVDAFLHEGGRDLTGYEDGTENPEGDEAETAALVSGQGAGLDGGSFVAVQQWQHDMKGFHRLAPAAQDDIIGRHRESNEEFDEAPESAHVKRSAQESFSPEAFMLRRSMPWVAGQQAGLVFVAFGHSFEAYNAVMERMVGLEDGITDALFTISRPLTGAFFWCPPMADGRLDLSRLGV